MELLKKMKNMGINIASATHTVGCKVFDANAGAIEIVEHHKYHPRTKHLIRRSNHSRDDNKELDILLRVNQQIDNQAFKCNKIEEAQDGHSKMVKWILHLS